MGAFEDGSTFLAGVLAKLPEAARAQAKAIFETPEAKDAVIVIGDGVLARPDYSRAMNDLKTKETELTQKFNELNDWWSVNEAALTEYKTIKPEYDTLKGQRRTDPPSPTPSTPPPDARQIALDVVNEAGREYVGVSAWLAGKVAVHQQMFGEPLDAMALVSNPKLGKPIPGQPGRVFSLQDAYNEQFGEKVAAKAKEADEKRINDEVAKRLAEERAKSVGQPFPLRGEAPSVLDVLQTKEGPAAHTLDTAVAEYELLQQARGT
jgi:hypothetical protein